jgi:CubicO group peptidase (beta-lactamase class C family)
MAIEGTNDPRFARLREAFASLMSDGQEFGGAVAVTLDGKPVADLWGGHADAARTQPWRADTLANVWSVTKGVMALAVAMQVERGRLAYARPVAEVWPEFATNCKEAITLDLVLSHQAGLNGLTKPMGLAGLYAWTPYADALAAMAPLWAPGSRFVYHALSYGHLAGEPLRRVTGRSVGRVIAEDIAGPLGAAFYIGLPESEEPRVAELIEGPGASDWVADVAAGPYPNSVINPAVTATLPNSRAWRAAEIPGGNGHATALGLATIYGAMVRKAAPVLTPATLAQANHPRFIGPDAGNGGQPTAYSAGFRLLDPEYGPHASPRSFGHAGWGGSIAFADPDARLGFAYVTNHLMGFDDADPRRRVLVDAVYDALRA